MNLIREIYMYREMIYCMVKRDLRGRYKGSILGFLWTFINPLLQLLVYTVVFSSFLKMGINKYEIFLFVALIPWMFFANSMISSAGAILYNKNLVTKIYFPREVLPITMVTANFINMIYGLIIVLLVVILFNSDSINLLVWLYLPVVMIIEFVFALGISFFVSAATVYVRDLEHILGVVVLAWQFLTPVMYPDSFIPDNYRFFISMNPMASIIISYRNILYYGIQPDINLLLVSAIESIAMFCIGFSFFEKLKKTFAEEL